MSLLLGLGCTSTAGPVVLERLADAQRHPEAKAFVVRAERVEGVIGVASTLGPRPPLGSGIDGTRRVIVSAAVPLVDPGTGSGELVLAWGVGVWDEGDSKLDSWVTHFDQALKDTEPFDVLCRADECAERGALWGEAVVNAEAASGLQSHPAAPLLRMRSK